MRYDHYELSAWQLLASNVHVPGGRRFVLHRDLTSPWLISIFFWYLAKDSPGINIFCNWWPWVEVVDLHWLSWIGTAIHQQLSWCFEVEQECHDIQGDSLMGLLDWLWPFKWVTLQFCTDFSVRPLLCEYCGLVIMGAKFPNSLHWYRGQLYNCLSQGKQLSNTHQWQYRFLYHVTLWTNPIWYFTVFQLCSVVDLSHNISL